MTREADFFKGDVVLHRDGDLPETVISVEPVKSVLPGNHRIYLRTATRFRPAEEFTFTGLKVV